MGIVSSQSVCNNFVLLGIIYQKKTQMARKYLLLGKKTLLCSVNPGQAR